MMFFGRLILFIPLFFIILLGPAVAEDATLDKIIVKLKENSSPFMVGEDDIDSKSLASISDLFNYSLGSELIQRGIYGAQQDISVRGGNFEQNAVMLDNQRLNDPQTGHFNLDLPLTLEDIDTVMVMPLKSGSALMPDAISGGVNFIIKRPKDNKLVAKVFGGNHDTYSGLVSTSIFRNNIGNRVSFEKIKSDGFQPHTDNDNISIFDSLYLTDEENNLDVNFGYSQKDFGAYDFYTPGKGYPSREKTRTKLVSARGELVNYSIKFKPNIRWRRHYDTFILNENKPNLYLNNHRSDIFSAGLDGIFSFGKIGESTFGTEAREERINSLRLGKRCRNSFAFYFDDKAILRDDLLLDLRARSDWFDNFGSQLCGFLGLEYLINDYTFYFNVSRSVRIPTYTELYYSDSTTVGDPTLKKESALNYQVGYNKNKDLYSFGQNVFFRDEFDAIDWVKTQSETRWIAKNINAYVFGLENFIKIRPLEQVEWYLNYSYINKPPDKDFSYKYGPSNFRNLASSGINLFLGQFLQSLDLVYKNKPTRDGWFLLSSKTEYNLNNNIRIFLETNNLINVEYEEIPGIPSPGRLVRAGMRLEW